MGFSPLQCPTSQAMLGTAVSPSSLPHGSCCSQPVVFPCMEFFAVSQWQTNIVGVVVALLWVLSSSPWCHCYSLKVMNMLWLQVNGMNVACASHEYAVQLIRESGNELVLRVLTVASSSSERHSTMNIHDNGKEAWFDWCICIDDFSSVLTTSV